MTRATWPLGTPDSPEYHEAWLQADRLATELGAAVSARDQILNLMACGMTVEQIRAKMTGRNER